MAHIAKVFQTEKKETSAGYGEFANVRARGQTFKALSTAIRAISVYVQFDGGGSGVGVKISFYNVNQTTNLPTGAALYSFNVYPANYTQNKVNKFDLPAALTGLTVNTKYAFTLEPVAANGTYTDYYRDTKFTTDMTTLTDGISIRNNNGTWATENLQMFFELFDDYTVTLGTADYSQPTLPEPVDGSSNKIGWNFNSVDTQIISRHWDQPDAKIEDEVEAIAALGVTHIAIGTHYNRPKHMKKWIDAIRAEGKKVFFRGNWGGWEGQYDFTPSMTREEYLTRTYKFIVDNPTFFESGDLFAMCVEPNNANDAGNTTFRTSGSFDITKFNDFLKDQVRYANQAFSDASITGVFTFPISPSLSLVDLDGETLDSGNTGSGSGIDDAFVTSYFDGILSIDHYLQSSVVKASGYFDKYSSDLDKIHAAFPNAKLFIGEWGFHTETDYGEQVQYELYDQVVNVLRSKPYVCGVNFWNHMGQAQSSIFNESSGNIGAGKRATEAVEHAFKTPNAARGWTN